MESTRRRGVLNKVNKKDFVRAAMRRSGLNRTGFCMRHDCSRKDDLGRPNNCCPAASPCKLAPGATHHLLFVHVEKTGGSSVECATQEWARAGYWTNMGHVGTDGRGDVALRACRRRCEEAGVPTAVVISVRDPYAYWQSVLRYAWRMAGTRLSATFNALSNEFQRSARVSRSQAGVFATLPRLLSWVESTPLAATCSANFSRCLSLSGRIKRACGGSASGCAADFTLHTESLARDWAALAARYGLPRLPLPHVEPGSGYSKRKSCHCSGRCDPQWWRRDGGFGCTDAPRGPALDFTPDARAIVGRLEREVFDTFHYPLVAR